MGDPFDRCERGMPFVEVVGGRFVAEFLKSPHASDPEKDLLPHPGVGIALVEPLGQLSVLIAVLFSVRIEQQEFRSSDLHLPDTRHDVSIPERTEDVDPVSSIGISSKSYFG